MSDMANDNAMHTITQHKVTGNPKLSLVNPQTIVLNPMPISFESKNTALAFPQRAEGVFLTATVWLSGMLMPIMMP